MNAALVVCELLGDMLRGAAGQRQGLHCWDLPVPAEQQRAFLRAPEGQRNCMHSADAVTEPSLLTGCVLWCRQSADSLQDHLFRKDKSRKMVQVS